MKKLFTVFCAVCLMPTFSAQAWIGGPFSNNSFFGESGDDGIYEVAATTVNGIGLFRIVVGNAFPGVNPGGPQRSIPGDTTSASGTAVTTLVSPPIASGNTIVGGLRNPFNNVWYVAGTLYMGYCVGTASSVMGIVQGIGFATNPAPPAVPIGTLNSQFTAYFQGSGKFVPARGFSGTGFYSINVGPQIGFTVFGSKVSHRITWGS